MRTETRDRYVLPVVIPVGIMAGIGVLVFSFSRILLAVPRQVAIVLALAAAVDILVVATLVAGRREDAPALHVPLIVVSAGAIVIGGLIAMRTHPPAEAKEVAAPPAGPTVTAKNVAFDLKDLKFSAGAKSVLHFVNADAGVPHNVAIFKDSSASEVLFRGEIVTGPAKKEYSIPAMPAGSYFFHCDVHPAMSGTVTVAAGAAGGGGGAGAAPGVSVRAHNIAFETAEIDLPAGRESTIKFTNADPSTPHNIAIYGDEAATEKLFTGALVTGPATATYKVKPLDAGTYFFRCDVHPAMKGTVVVK